MIETFEYSSNNRFGVFSARFKNGIDGLLPMNVTYDLAVDIPRTQVFKIAPNHL